MEQIEDVLDRSYRLNTSVPLVCEVGGTKVDAKLMFKKVGTPSRMAFVVDFVHPKTGVAQSEPLNSSPMYLRCSAAHALPLLLEAIKNEHLAAQTRLREAVQSATAFLEKMG